MCAVLPLALLRGKKMADKPQIIEVAHYSCNYTVFDVRWVPTSARFVVLGNHARGTGALDICELDGPAVKVPPTRTSA